MKQVSTQAAAWRACLGIVTSASLLLAGCSSSSNSTALQSNPSSTTTSAAATPAATPAVAQGTERGIAEVPWSQVGPGWMLAVWTPVTPHIPRRPTRAGRTDARDGHRRVVSRQPGR
jgi:hypothetical protein